MGLSIDADISTAVFQHDAREGVGAFLPDPGLEKAQSASHVGTRTVGTKIEFLIDTLEIWGVSHTHPAGGGDGEEGEDEDEEVVKQKKRLEWEEVEAARRAGVNFGGDKEGARALLEMAGLVGGDESRRSGGSV